MKRDSVAAAERVAAGRMIWTPDDLVFDRKTTTTTSPDDAPLREAAGGPRDDAWQTAVAAFLARWPAVASPIVAGLAAGAERVARTGNLAGFGGLAAPTPAVVMAGRALAEAMTPLAAQTAAATVADAAAQGTDIADVPAPDGDRLLQVATATVALIAAVYATAAGQAALAAPAAGVAAAVTATLTTMGAAARGLVATQIGAAMSAAEHEGRRAVFAAHPPQELVASEAGERNRCKPCDDIDGHAYPSLEAALADYPMAGYAHCLGGPRCRGELKGRWT